MTSIKRIPRVHNATGLVSNAALHSSVQCKTFQQTRFSDTVSKGTGQGSQILLRTPIKWEKVVPGGFLCFNTFLPYFWIYHSVMMYALWWKAFCWYDRISQGTSLCTLIILCWKQAFCNLSWAALKNIFVSFS